MGNKALNTELFDKAAKFAIDAHSGIERRGKGFPYAIHVMEAAAIVATITNDQEMIAAALLHDVIEDTDVTEDILRKEFGDRIADLVAGESDIEINDKSESASWKERKEFAINRLKAQGRDEKIVAMGDKLSNLRAIARDYRVQGEKLWDIFHAPDPALHEWHYRGLADSLSDLDGTFAYEEFCNLIKEIWG